MFENPKRVRQERNFTTNVPKILDLKSSSKQIPFRKLTLGAPEAWTCLIVLVIAVQFKMAITRTKTLAHPTKMPAMEANRRAITQQQEP